MWTDRLLKVFAISGVLATCTPILIGVGLVLGLDPWLTIAIGLSIAFGLILICAISIIIAIILN